ncbi:hypothetical protein GCM10009661_09460 [Catellatospora chokoriensis]
MKALQSPKMTAIATNVPMVPRTVSAVTLMPGTSMVATQTAAALAARRRRIPMVRHRATIRPGAHPPA